MGPVLRTHRSLCDPRGLVEGASGTLSACWTSTPFRHLSTARPPAGQRALPPRSPRRGYPLDPGSLGQQFLHDFSVHVRQPVVPATMTVRQPRVIDPQQMQDRGMKIVDVDRILSAPSRAMSSACP